jgi:PST family polysaccharide transporter
LRLVTNYLSLAAGEVVSKLFTFAAIAYIARVAGPTGFGYLEFAASIMLCAGLLVDQGFGLYGAREIARDAETTDTLVAEVTFLRFLLAIIAFACILALVGALDRPPGLERLIVLYGLSLFPMPWMLQWVFQGHDRMGAVASMQVMRQGVYAVVVVAFLRDATRLWSVALAEAAGIVAVATVSLWLYRRCFGQAAPFRPVLSVRLIREGATIGLSQVFWSARMFGATVVVGLVATAEDVGYFGAAMRILIALHVFVWLYYFNLLPSLSRAWAKALEPFQRLVDKSTSTVAWLSIGGGILWILLAPAAIRLTYGNAFSPAISVLQWLSVVCILAAIDGHFRFALIAANRQGQEMAASAIGALVALSLIAPAYHRFGVDGAAVALVAGEFAVWISSWIFSHRSLHLGHHAHRLRWPLTTTVAVVAPLWFLLPEDVPPQARALTCLGVTCIAAYAADAGIRLGLRGFLASAGEKLRT